MTKKYMNNLGMISTLVLTFPALTGASAEGCNGPEMVPPSQGAYAAHSPWTFHSRDGVWEFKADGTFKFEQNQVSGHQKWLVYQDYNTGDLACTAKEGVQGTIAESGTDTTTCEDCTATYMVRITPGETDCPPEILSQVFGAAGWHIRDEVWGTSAVNEETIPSYWQNLSDEIQAMNTEYAVWIYDTSSAKRAFFPYFALSETIEQVEIPKTAKPPAKATMPTK